MVNEYSNFFLIYLMF